MAGIKMAPANPLRLLVVEHIYYQQPGQEIAHQETQHSRRLESNEQLYTRFKMAGESWERLEYGWVGHAAMVHVTHEKTADRSVRPTEAELATEAGRVLEVAVFPPDAPAQLLCWLAPGESLRLPNPRLPLLVRGSLGATPYKLVVYPA